MDMMEVATLTSKGLVVYYSATGNTKSVAEMFPSSLYDIVSAKSLDLSKLNNYNVIVLGMSTWQRGMPPKVFQKIAPYLQGLKGKTFYLFGSGRIEYEYYCGALDLFEEVLNRQNRVEGVLKYEGYPSNNTAIEAHRFITYINDKLEERLV